MSNPSTKSGKHSCTSCHSSRRRIITKHDTYTYKGESIDVDFKASLCRECNTEYITGEQSQEISKSVIREYKKRKQLLPGASLKRIRKKIGYSQAKLEALLGIGKNTIIRYEKDLVSQSASIDRNYRLLDMIDSDWTLVFEIFPELEISRVLPTCYPVKTGATTAERRGVIVNVDDIAYDVKPDQDEAA